MATSVPASPSLSAISHYHLVPALMAFSIAHFINFFTSCYVMYDASGVRLQAGRQAEVLNPSVYELPAEHPLSESRPLSELLGHTPTQVVAGCFQGIATALMVHLVIIMILFI